MPSPPAVPRHVSGSQRFLCKVVDVIKKEAGNMREDIPSKSQIHSNVCPGLVNPGSFITISPYLPNNLLLLLLPSLEHLMKEIRKRDHLLQHHSVSPGLLPVMFGIVPSL